MDYLHAPVRTRSHLAHRRRAGAARTRHGTWLVPIILALLLACLSAPPSYGAEGRQALDAIRATVVHFVTEQLDDADPAPRIEVGKLDPRLRLAPCGTPLSAAFPPGSRRVGSTTVGVRCAGPRPWSLYVPVRVRLYRQVVVMTRPVAPGQILTHADLRLEERNLDDLVSGFFTDPLRLVGMQMKRSIKPGQPLNRLSVAAPRLVRRGQRVTVLAVTGGLEVRVQGKALADGAQGERIRVRNLGTKRVVEAMVAAEGLVRVRL